MLLNVLTFFRYRSIKTIRTFGRAGLMLFSILIRKPEFNKSTPLLIYQLYNVGVLSTFTIVISGLFVGMVLSLQGYLILIIYGAESNLGMLISISLLRELGPVFTALLFIGRISSALTADVGFMCATEQFSSMEMMAVDPLRRIIAPRFWAGIISLPLLTLIFIVVGTLGSSLIGIYWKCIDSGFFWSTMQEAINLRIDLINCIIKSLIFAIVATWIALFNGYNAIPTSSGINQATMRTIAYSSIAILSIDFLLTALFFGI